MITLKPFINVKDSLQRSIESAREAIKWANWDDVESCKEWLAFADNHFAPVQNLIEQGLTLPDALAETYAAASGLLNRVREIIAEIAAL